MSICEKKMELPRTVDTWDMIRALKLLTESIRLMEQSRGAVKSKTIAHAREAAEKARAILEAMI